MDCETNENVILRLEESLRRSDGQVERLKQRMSLIGQELFSESYQALSMGEEIGLRDRLFLALDSFGASLREIQRSRAESLMSERFAACRRKGSGGNGGEPFGPTSLRSLTEAAKVDLLVYKFDVYQVFMGRSQKEAADFVGYHRCLLDCRCAEWAGQECCLRPAGYRGLEAANSRLLGAGIEAVFCFRKGDRKRAFDAAARMEEASRDVLVHLDKIAAGGVERP